MKTKIIPFNLEMAKKIQAGEIKGSIKTREGNKARILCTDLRNHKYPIVVATTINSSSGDEILDTYTLNGFFAEDEREHECNLILEVPEVPDDEPQFDPFDRVLVRVGAIWQAAHFSHIESNEEGKMFAITTSGDVYPLANTDIIPYEGNEQLVGTTNKPKEE